MSSEATGSKRNFSELTSPTNPTVKDKRILLTNITDISYEGMLTPEQELFAIESMTDGDPQQLSVKLQRETFLSTKRQEGCLNALLERVEKLEDDIQKNYDAMEMRIERIEASLNRHEKGLIKLCDDLARLENHSRSWNIRVLPFPDNVETKDENTEAVVRDMFRKEGVEMELGEVDICHRVGRLKDDKGDAKQRTILLRMVHKKECREIFSKRKKLFDNGIKIFRDVSQLDVQKRLIAKPLIDDLVKNGVSRKDIYLSKGKLVSPGEQTALDLLPAYKKCHKDLFA